MSDDIRKQNADELQRKWKQFLKEQRKKYGREKSAGSVKG